MSSMCVLMRAVIVMRMGMRGHDPSSCEITLRVNIFNPSLASLIYRRHRETGPTT